MVKSSVFLDAAPLCSVKINRRCCLLHAGLLPSSLFDSDDGEIYPSETSVDFHCNTRCYIRKHRTLHSHCCENLKSNAGAIVFSDRAQNFVVFLTQSRRNEDTVPSHSPPSPFSESIYASIIGCIPIYTVCRFVYVHKISIHEHTISSLAAGQGWELLHWYQFYTD
jgi:hypothetical protein